MCIIRNRISILYLGFLISVVNGNIPKKIYGGTKVEIWNYPYQVSIQYQNMHICGGVIISKYFVLSAANCPVSDRNIFYANLEILSGTEDLNDKYPYGISNINQVSHILFHEDYDPRNYWINDIAILKLTNELDFNGFRERARMPPPKPNGKKHTLGWGVDPINNILSRYLQKLDVKTLEPRKCRTQFYGNQNDRLHRNQHCLILPSPSNLITMGSAGSPVMNGRRVIGIISIDIWDPKFPPLYTRVYSYIDWMEKMMQKV